MRQSDGHLTTYSYIWASNEIVFEQAQPEGFTFFHQFAKVSSLINVRHKLIADQKEQYLGT